MEHRKCNHKYWDGGFERRSLGSLLCNIEEREYVINACHVFVCPVYVSFGGEHPQPPMKQCR